MNKNKILLHFAFHFVYLKRKQLSSDKNKTKKFGGVKRNKEYAKNVRKVKSSFLKKFRGLIQ